MYGSTGSKDDDIETVCSEKDVDMQALKGPVRSDEDDEASPRVFDYFILICTTTVFRSIEVGIISSMMVTIKDNLGFNYSSEGSVAASPEYGLIPGAIMAIFAFDWVPAKYVLTSGYFVIAITQLLCCVFPNTNTLIYSRALGGFAWGFAAVHYPAWIIKRGPKNVSTRWLGIYNASLIIGILLGYLVGAILSMSEVGNQQIAWLLPYTINAVAQLGLAFFSCTFPSELVQTVRHALECPETRTSVTPESTTEILWKLLSMKLYLIVVALAGLIGGETAFILYFIQQFLQWQHFSVQSGYIAAAAIMILAPVPGNLIGAEIVSRAGGFKNYPATFKLFLVTGAIFMVATPCILVAARLKSHAFFIVSFFVLVFAGAIPAAGINELTVSLMPSASHYASGVQFAIQNTAKLLVPQAAGILINYTTMFIGFATTFSLLSGSFFCIAFYGWMQSRTCLEEKDVK